MKLPPGDKKFYVTVALMVLAVITVFLITHRFLSGSVVSLNEQILKLEPEIRKPRNGQFQLDEQMSKLRKLKADTTTELNNLKARLEFKWPDWVTPSSDVKPAEYFRSLHSKWRMDSTTICTTRNVQLFDGDLGFTDRGVIDKTRAEEDLRSLSIVVSLIDLLANIQVTAITEIRPQDSILTGSFRVLDNPRYKVGSNEPKTIRLVNPAFIREYPVKLGLICDLTTLMKFLSSIRQENQFFLIRDISITATPPKDPHVAEFMKEGDVYITISAAAMRFLTKEEHDEQVAKTTEDQKRFKTFSKMSKTELEQFLGR